MSIRRLVMAVLLFCGVSTGSVYAETLFTYQGKLGSAGQAADGAHDFVFRLFDAQTNGTQLGQDEVLSSIDVDVGVFTVQLDFGGTAFNASPRWLEISVREAGSGNYTTLSPRQRIGASPFAIETLFVAPGGVDTAALKDNAVTTNKIANGNVFTDDLANYAVSTIKLSNQAVTRVKLADDSVGTTQIENNTVTTSDIRDGTIQTEDLANVFLYDKTQIIVVNTPLNVPAFDLRAPTAQCPDENDIPLATACDNHDNSTQIVLRGTSNDNWSSNSDEASTTCLFDNLDSTPKTVSTSIYCLSVP